MTKEELVTDLPRSERLDRIFESLPTLGSPEYLKYIRSASEKDLPAEVLARAYRILKSNGQTDAARVTLGKLLSPKPSPSYLKPVWYLARNDFRKGEQAYEPADLIMATIEELISKLDRPSGDMAERAWGGFCKSAFRDAWRKFYGRNGKKQIPEANLESYDDAILEDQRERFELSQLLPHVAPGEVENAIEIIRTTIHNIEDEVIRGVAENYFLSSDELPVDRDSSGSGKLSLTKRFNCSRRRIYDARKAAEARIVAALMADPNHNLDTDVIRRWFNKHS